MGKYMRNVQWVALLLLQGHLSPWHLTEIHPFQNHIVLGSSTSHKPSSVEFPRPCITISQCTPLWGNDPKTKILMLTSVLMLHIHKHSRNQLSKCLCSYHVLRYSKFKVTCDLDLLTQGHPSRSYKVLGSCITHKPSLVIFPWLVIEFCQFILFWGNYPLTKISMITFVPILHKHPRNPFCKSLCFYHI